MTDVSGTDAAAYREALDFLLAHREDYAGAVRDFRWPELSEFNWALDHFSPLARELGGAPALVWDGGQVGYAELDAWSSRAANFLRKCGVRRGDRVLLMLSNVPELWAAFLACMKLGAVVIPATTLLTPDDLRDRFERGGARCAVVEAAETPKFTDLVGFERISVGPVEGWTDFARAQDEPAEFEPDGVTRASDPLLLYFTSGTTSRPKLVLHTHASYPAGHLSTLYWIGLRRGDVHWNVSSPGWAKHAWSSFFAPLTVGAAVVLFNERFDARRVLELLERLNVTTLCAPPTVYRMLIQQDLAGARVGLREVVGAGEPLNPEVIEVVRRAWGLTIRDGYGQTETTAQVGNTPGQPVKPGSMGRPLPGYRVALLDAAGREADEGELSLDLSARPLGLMAGYAGDEAKTRAVLGGAYYPTGDVARRDEDGYLWYVGRADDVFKSSDYRISPFELESLLIEHPLVAEAAVVPSPHPERLSVPKAYVVLVAGAQPSRETALDILRFTRERLAPYKRVRRLAFRELPKTISGKIRRVELRAHAAEPGRAELEFWEEDFEELR
ncbi:MULTISPECIES: AMP-binding protein [Deinococcus]|uniref:AMP-binding protein n=1 Tax=Deinococcus TaxID=1298 RepID=UPI0018DFC0C3|nr:MULTISPECIES: AMP-binding protein [Deinococcus]MBI0446514.1 AMP-dependent synthetase [Deinococcus sp. DB0503]